MAFPLVVAAGLAIWGAIGSDQVIVPVLSFLVPTALFGAAANRWWALTLPTAWAAIYLAVLRIIDLQTGACHACGEDEDWGNYPLFALLAGVGARKATDVMRRRLSDLEGAPPA